MNNTDYYTFIENNITDRDISYRGGTLKIDVSELLDTGDEPAIMGASQNYLGGGIAGAITTGSMFDTSILSEKDLKTYQELAEVVIQYFHDINNGGGDEYMQENYSTLEQNQSLPVSAM